MAQTSANLVDHVLPRNVPLRQWVLTFPFELRGRLGFNAKLLSAVCRVAVDALLGFYERRLRNRVAPLPTLASESANGPRLPKLQGGTVTVVQRTNSARGCAPQGVTRATRPKSQSPRCAQVTRRARAQALRGPRFRPMMNRPPDSDRAGADASAKRDRAARGMAELQPSTAALSVSILLTAAGPWLLALPCYPDPAYKASRNDRSCISRGPSGRKQVISRRFLGPRLPIVLDE
jgi:hypothetical protein